MDSFATLSHVGPPSVSEEEGSLGNAGKTALTCPAHLLPRGKQGLGGDFWTQEEFFLPSPEGAKRSL